MAPSDDHPHAGGTRDLVQLDPDHPGFRDPAYRQRRNAIAKLALEYREPAPVPQVDYSEAEQEVWRTVWKNLAPLHQQYACVEYVDCSAIVALERQRVPQLEEVNQRLKGATGFQMLPVAGLVSDRTFLGYLGRSTFLSTQYMRHPSCPLYTPEPDVVHELVGHAATFAHPGFAAMNRAFGAAIERADEARLAKIARVYWYTLEFGVVRERGKLKVYGAGLLSSFGELGRFEQQAQLKDFDLEEISGRPYDPTDYQRVLYVAPSFDEMVRGVTAWLKR
jgi:phenylalanine-4-hydroxylase